MNNAMGQFVIWADVQNSDTSCVEALSYEGSANAITEPPLNAADFVILTDAAQDLRWFGQVIEPQRNLPLQGLSRDNPSNIAAMERVLAGTIESSIFMRQVYHFKIKLIGIIDAERLRSVTRRPRAGALGRIASPAEAIRYLDLPALLDTQAWHKNLLGCIHGSDIPIAIGKRQVFYHMLVCGATGSGKTNTVGNVIKAAQNHGLAVVVFDHKPDYQNVHEPNDEVVLFEKFSALDVEPIVLSPVKYFALAGNGRDEERTDQITIRVQASDLPSSMFAAALFPEDSEAKQLDAFLTLRHAFVEKTSGRAWQFDEFKAWCDALAKKEKDLDRVFSGHPPHDLVWTAMTRRFKKIPHWVDGLPSGAKGSTTIFRDRDASPPLDYFQIEKHLMPGAVSVIRVSADGREYGLFASYLLNQMLELRIAGKIPPVQCIVDEAQDIFQGGPAIERVAVNTMAKIMRKGRSKQMGFLLSVQSASEIPHYISQNLNSKIVHRQNNTDELKVAMPNAPRETLNMALSFGPGEALVDLFGARTVLHADMLPSPFMITKDIEYDAQTLADQIGPFNE